MNRVAGFLVLLAACGGGNAGPEGFGGGPGGGGGSDGGGSADVGSFGSTDAGDGGEQRACQNDSDCNDGNPCTTYHCDKSTEFGTCSYAPVADGASCGGDAGCPATCMAGVCAAQNGGNCGGFQPPIDPQCTCPNSLQGVFPPYVPLQPPDVPQSCANGFEIGGARGGCGAPTSKYTITSTRQGGANAITLDIDLATYLVQDGVEITGVDASGHEYTLLSECRMQTWTQGGPSNKRPPDVSIRQFRVDVKQGTKQLTFDFGNVVSPMYLQVLGLCDFDVAPFTGSVWFQPVP